MKKKITSKSKKKPTYWDRLIAKSKPRKARPKHKAARKPQPKVKPMATKKETKADAKATASEEQAEQTFLAKQTKKPKAEQADALQPREGEEEFLPPPDPPVVPSEPTDPPEPLEVEDIPQKGATPEDTSVDVKRELNIAPETEPNSGPRPEEEPEPKEAKE